MASAASPVSKGVVGLTIKALQTCCLAVEGLSHLVESEQGFSKPVAPLD